MAGAGRARRPGRRFPRPRPGAVALAVALGFASGAATAACVTEAAYAEPVSRYGHGVLGAGGEYGALELRLTGQAPALRITLPPERVFEDIAPRVVDLDGDACAEVVVVESHARQGAQLAIYGGSGRKIAATPPIGQRFRWLAPAGIGDLDGDGAVELAYVDRPHLAKILRIWRYRDGALTEVARHEGVTNHRIGWDYIAGGLRECPGAAPALVLASADWRRIVALRLKDGSLAARDLGAYAPHALRRAQACD